MSCSVMKTPLPPVFTAFAGRARRARTLWFKRRGQRRAGLPQRRLAGLRDAGSYGCSRIY